MAVKLHFGGWNERNIPEWFILEDPPTDEQKAGLLMRRRGVTGRWDSLLQKCFGVKLRSPVPSWEMELQLSLAIAREKDMEVSRAIAKRQALKDAQEAEKVRCLQVIAGAAEKAINSELLAG